MTEKKTNQQYAGGRLQPSHLESREALRRKFWRTARATCPEVLEALAEIPIPEDRAAGWRRVGVEHSGPAGGTEASFEQALIEWARTHRVNFSWLLEQARETRIAWALGLRKVLDAEPLDAPRQTWSEAPLACVAIDDQGRVRSIGTEQAVESAPPPGSFDPTRELLENYLARAEKHARDVRRNARISGWVEGKRFTPAHLDWTARRLMRGESFDVIAKGSGATAAAVRIAVRRMVKELEAE